MRRFAFAACATALVLGCSGSSESDDVQFGQVKQGVGVGVPSSLGIAPGKLYLTFDDGPNAVFTPKVLDVLKAEEVPATFFVTGKNIRGNEAVIRRAASEGHVIANHQWEHVVASTAQLRVWAPKERDLLDEILGNKQHPYYFRYPFGSGTTSKEAVLRSTNYPDGGIGWHMDSLDWCFGNGRGTCRRPEVKAQYRSNFVEFVLAHAAERRGSGVLLFHDIQKITSQNIQTLIQRFKQRGYTFGQLPTEGHGFGGPR